MPSKKNLTSVAKKRKHDTERFGAEDEVDIRELVAAHREGRDAGRQLRRRELASDPLVRKAFVLKNNLEIAIDAVTNPASNRTLEDLRPEYERYLRRLVLAEALTNSSVEPTKEQRLHALFHILRTNCGALATTDSGKPRAPAVLDRSEALDAARMVAREYVLMFPDSTISEAKLLPVVMTWLDERRGRKPKGTTSKYEALRNALQGTPLAGYAAKSIEAERHKWERWQKTKSANHRYGRD